MAGNAVLSAAKQIKDELAGVVSARFDLNVVHEIAFADDRVFARARPDRGVTFGEAVAMATRAKRGGPVVGLGGYTPRGKGLVTPTFSFAAQVIELAVDPETGVVKVEEVTTAHDSGTIINPLGVEGQLHGSIHMGLGYALCEELVTRDGKTLNTTFLDYKLLAAEDMPRETSFAIEVNDPEGPYGAKEAGEGLVSPTAPAVSEAVRHATGFRCLDLPITPEKILRGTGRLAE
jgi:4-hydroxybenzoyl-CoA reductase subunit alpha